MSPGLQTLVFTRESKQGGGSWNVEPLGKPPVADSSALAPSSFRQVPSLFREKELFSLLPVEEAGTLVPDTEGNFRSAARALLFMYVTFSTWCENWHYDTLRVRMMAEHGQNPLIQTIVPSDPTFTASCF